MKVIDLLNKIANGEEVPKKIKVHRPFFEEWETIEWNEKLGDYVYDGKDELYTERAFITPCFGLNEEIEVLDKE